MIRGAFILAVGFGLGYAKAMQEQEATAQFLESTKGKLSDLIEALEKKNAQPPTDAPETPEASPAA